jgi:hypothetical protein
MRRSNGRFSLIAKPIEKTSWSAEGVFDHGLRVFSFVLVMLAGPVVAVNPAGQRRGRSPVMRAVLPPDGRR